MRITYLAYWIGLISLLFAIEVKNVKYRYFTSGENITLSCNFEVSSWSGPAVNIFEPNNVVEFLYKFGILVKWKVTTYTKGHTVKKTLPQNLYKRLNLQGDKFDLLITNMSTSDEGLYICDPKSTAVLQKRFLLQNKYKPSIKVNVSDTFITEGETTHLCCNSTSNPKPTSISWYAQDKELVSTNSESSLCYTMSNVSRNDTGNYTCSSKNEIGNTSRDIMLVILYPPVVYMLHNTLTKDNKIIKIHCIAQGEPDSYNFLPWEHRSVFEEHIRYLNGTDDGILELPQVNLLDRYQDTGIYICNVTNGIPDYRGNIFQHRRLDFVSTGPPVFMKKTQIIQYGREGHQHNLTVYVYSVSKITCSTTSNLYGYSFPYTIRLEPIITPTEFHGQTIRIHGLLVVFSLQTLSRLDFQIYKVTLCNRYGNISFHVELKRTVNYSSEEKTLSTEGIQITIIVFLIIILAGIGIYVKYLKQMYRKKLITQITMQTPERNNDESAHYADIIEDDNNTLNRRQGNIDQGIALADIAHVVVEHRDITDESEENSSTISDNDVNGSDIFDDGYEKPYSTLLETDRDENKHVYLSTRNSLINEDSPSSEPSACGNCSGLIEHHYIPEITKSNDVEYINLSLEQ